MTKEPTEGLRYRTRNGLSDRQKQVLDLLVKGRTNRGIADELGITFDSAKWHVSQILSELGVDTREEAAEWWRQQNGLRARLRIPVRSLTAPGIIRWLGLGGAGAGALAMVAIVGVILAGRGVSEDPNGSSPQRAETSTVTPPFDEPPQSGTQNGLAAAPPTGGPCPVDDDICVFALDILPLLLSGDVDQLMSLAEPAPFRCPGDFMGDAPGVCEGVPDGELARAFVVVGGGEGSTIGPGEFRARLVLALDSIARADANRRDAYDDGRLQLGSVGCSRTLQQNSGECAGNVEIVYSHIDPEWPVADAQRVVTCLRATRTQEDRLALTGVGCAIPPTALLYDLEISGLVDEDTQATFQWYPWRVKQDPPLSPPTLRLHDVGMRTGIGSVDGVVVEAERGDFEAIQSRLAFNDLPCVREPEPGEVDCGKDWTPGDIIRAFPFWFCTPRTLWETAPLASVVAFPPLPRLGNVYAAVRLSAPIDGWIGSTGSIAIIMATEPFGWSWLLTVGDDGRVDGLYLGCGSYADVLMEKVEPVADESLVPPPS